MPEDLGGQGLNYRYNAVVDLIRKRIEAGTLTEGDRLPSIRELSRSTGYSTVTIHHGYEILEALGYCTTRARSGFYITRAPEPEKFPPIGETSGEPALIQDLPEALILASQDEAVAAFGAPHPSRDVFDGADLDRIMRRYLRFITGPASPPEGIADLRTQIARRVAQRGIIARYQDILVAGSALQAFNLCLDAFTNPGDVILVESPSYFPALAAIRRRNLRVVELYSHPRTGADPGQFEYLVKNSGVRVALLMANHHFPTGVTYSVENMQRIVAIARANDVMILENDTLGELAYASTGAPSLKQFDAADNVLQFSSFEYSLAPVYGLGWVIAGKHTKRLQAAAYLGGYAVSDSRIQHTIAEFLSGRAYDRHITRVREAYASRMARGLALLTEGLPREYSVSQPTGGFMCWVRAPQSFSSRKAGPALNKHGVGILAGPIFSAAGSYDNFFALNFSFPWTKANEDKIARLIEVGVAS